MTHDELLADINEAIQYEEDKQVWKALRAVVELHKPSEKKYTGEIGCVGCGYNSEYSTWEMEYPCPTIQAIEKELG